MKRLRSTYVHRGDAIRRRQRATRLLVWVAVFSTVGFVIANRRPSTPIAEASAETAGSTSSMRFGLMWENRRLRQAVENAAGEAELLRARMDRVNKIVGFSAQYRIPADLATTIFDVALREGLDPALAFQLVRLESSFNPRAVSRVGALGLAQVMMPTARHFDPEIQRENLYDPRTNLSIGFRHLRRLIAIYDGNVRFALLAYNLGEPAVDRKLRAGLDPLVGYDRILLKNYQGTGVSN